MIVTGAKAIAGLAVSTGSTAPSVVWPEEIGTRQLTALLPDCSTAYEVSGVLQSIGNTATLDLLAGGAAVTGAVVAASGTFTLTNSPSAGDTVTIGTTVYTWRTVLSIPAVPYEVKIDGTNSTANLAAAINAGAGAGTAYSTGTIAHTSVQAGTATSTTCPVTAKTAGAAGNAIATIENTSNGSWAHATLTGGIGASTLTGGDGLDISGNDILADGIEGLLIWCASGGFSISNPDGEFVTELLAGGFLVLGNPGGTFPDADLVLTATRTGTAFGVTVACRYQA